MKEDEYFRIHREGGMDAVKARWPDHPWFTCPGADMAELVKVETCYFLSGCHCVGSAKCLLFTWPVLKSLSDCLACPVKGEM